MDGSIEEYNDIFLFTGYSSNKFAFLPDGFTDGLSHTRRDRYLGVFHPQLPGIAFIGFSRGLVGSLVLGFELQARWFALIASGKRSLPNIDKMKTAIANDIVKKDCYEY